MDLPVLQRVGRSVPRWMAVTASLATGVAILLVQFGGEWPGNSEVVLSIVGMGAIGGWFWWRNRDQERLNADQLALVDRALSTGEPSGDDAVDSEVLSRLEARVEASRWPRRWGARAEALSMALLATGCAVHVSAWWWLSVVSIGPWVVSALLPQRVAGPTLDDFRASLTPAPR